jgi:hypothetical protein
MGYFAPPKLFRAFSMVGMEGGKLRADVLGSGHKIFARRSRAREFDFFFAIRCLHLVQGALVWAPLFSATFHGAFVILSREKSGFLPFSLKKVTSILFA